MKNNTKEENYKFESNSIKEDGINFKNKNLNEIKSTKNVLSESINFTEVAYRSLSSENIDEVNILFLFIYLIKAYGFGRRGM